MSLWMIIYFVQMKTEVGIPIQLISIIYVEIIINVSVIYENEIVPIILN